METDKILFVKDNKLYLDTSMTQSAFSKSRLSERLTEEGSLAEQTGSSWNFSPWTFTGTQINACTEENRNAASRALAETVLLEGDAFNGSTLKTLFDKETEENTDAGKAQAAAGAAIVISAIEYAIEHEIKLCDNGAGGIFISSDFTKIIFMPEDLFETAVTCRGDLIYSEYEGMYIYRTLAGNAALHFTQAVFAYRALCGKFPFTNRNSVKRHEDYLDHNFEHLADTVYGLDSNLSFFIDSALTRNPHLVIHAKSSASGKRTFNEKITHGIKEGVVKEQNAHEERNILRAGMKFPLATFYRELGLTEAGTIPASGKQNDVMRKAKLTCAEFEAEAKKTNRAFLKSLSAKRWFRHYSTTIAVTSGVVVALAFFIFTYWSGNQKNPTTKSLTSTESIDMFYSAMNNLDVVAAQESSHGRNMESLVDVISNFYVTSKSRSAYSMKTDCVTPASWLCFNSKGNYTIFGLTQFTVDGKPQTLNFQGPPKNTHPQPLASEQNVQLTQNTQIEHEIHYYLVYSEGDSILHVVERTDKVTLTWIKNRWLLTGNASVESEKSADYKQFITDYNTMFAANDKDPVKTAEALSKAYPWISTASEVSEVKQILDSKPLF